MRKRRRLANKLTIMVCAVLVAVSAFFYVPMEVRADESLTLSGSASGEAELLTAEDMEELGAVFPPEDATYSQFYYKTGTLTLGSYDLANKYSLSDNQYYSVDLNISGEILISDGVISFPNNFVLINNNVRYELFPATYIENGVTSEDIGFVYPVTLQNKINLIFKGSDSVMNFEHVYNIYSKTVSVLGLECSLNFTFSNLIPLASSDSSDYQNGYNAGYSAGESAGYGNGYSQGFTDGEASVGTDAIYDEAFQAGKDSVDTQSYYDAGYQAGYDAAYATGYESGYDVGYQSAMDRIENWGADTTDYPLRISSGKDNGYFSVHVGSDIPFNYRDSVTWYNSNDYNPNHTYKYVINFSNLDVGLNSDILYDYWHLYLNIGGIEYILAPFNDTSVSVFIPGDRMSTSYSFDWVLYNCANFVSGDSNLAYLYVDYDFVIYDMGPSGDTQNHIANQTDQLTNGYDDSKGNEVNSELSTGLNEYQSAEDSLWATATTGLKDFTFFDFESVPAMITGMSFITSIMGKWFNEAGGASGVGIVLSILFSVMLVSMVLGLYRLYQSSSRRAELRQIHKESMERWKKGK